MALLGEAITLTAASRNGGRGPQPDDLQARELCWRPPQERHSQVKLEPRGRAMQATLAIVKPLSNFIYRAMQVGVLLIAAGTILGGVWADYSWGRFWGWDPKEVWALITLLVYLIPLHGRFAGWVSTFGLVAASVVCFLSVIMAWYGVNFVLGVGLHSYGFVEGGSQGIMLVILSGMLALPFGAGWRRYLGQQRSERHGFGQRAAVSICAARSETRRHGKRARPADRDRGVDFEPIRVRARPRARGRGRVEGHPPCPATAANNSPARRQCVRTPFSRRSRTLTPAAASLIKRFSTSAVGPRRPSTCQSSSQTSCASQ